MELGVDFTINELNKHLDIPFIIFEKLNGENKRWIRRGYEPLYNVLEFGGAVQTIACINDSTVYYWTNKESIAENLKVDDHHERVDLLTIIKYLNYPLTNT